MVLQVETDGTCIRLVELLLLALWTHCGVSPWETRSLADEQVYAAIIDRRDDFAVAFVELLTRRWLAARLPISKTLPFHELRILIDGSFRGAVTPTFSELCHHGYSH